MKTNCSASPAPTVSSTDPLATGQMAADAQSQSLSQTQTSRLILDIIFDYALNKFDDSRQRLEGGSTRFLAVIASFVAAGTRVEACLPAFPFKSANRVYKVLGTLPDKAEELALQRLDAMCRRIQEVYPPGARVTIISDGITYNDLLSISDRDTWAYGRALRELASKRKFDNVGFSRIKDLLDLPLPETLTEIMYIANCTSFRRELLNKYGKDDLDIDAEIANNPNTKLTYLGYKRFLESDLKYIFPQGPERGANEYKRDCKYIAKQMLIRGYAFARAIKHSYPNHLRLSIHESVAGLKLSICLLNTKTGFTTPWHCSVAQLTDGEWVSAPMGEFTKDERMEVVVEDGRPMYFRQRPSSHDETATATATVNYLQEAKQINMSDYLSSASTSRTVSPVVPSPKNFSAFSPREDAMSSRASTPGTHSPVILDTADGHEASLQVEKDTERDGSYGRRLIPQIMDSLAARDPGRIVFSLTTARDGSLGRLDVSAKTFTRAVDRLAWWIKDQVGISSSIKPVGYIGPHDLRHVLLTYASVKAGYSALFLSPKNSTEGALAVLDATKCDIWANAGEVPLIPLVKELLEKRPMKLLELPLLDDLLSDKPTEPFPYTKTFEEAKDEPFCYLHTSGTTGVPKPIPWSHGLIGTMDAVRLLPPVEGDHGLLPWTSDWKAGDKIYSSFPMSHGAGIIMDILMPALFDLQCVLGPVGVLPNINLIESLAENMDIDIWSMVPSLVDELGETPEVLAKLQKSKFICASGGPVSPTSAGKVNDVIRVLNLTGTTEGLFIGNLVVPREDWYWFCFHPYSGFEFKQVEEGTYEHWVHRNKHWPLFQGIFQTFPDKDSINFKDLYRRHPSKPHLWAFKGRSDDLVVLSNGYKISPLETEASITTHPAIMGCLIFGTGKPQAGLLIELKDGYEKTDELLDSIWDAVKQANSQSRHKDQLLRDFVTFSEPDKPFVRTDKGTIKRPATLALYEGYIDRFYGSRSDETTSSISIDITSADAIQNGLKTILSSVLPEIDQAAQIANFFDLGLDSLGVFSVVKSIRAATGLDEHLAPRHIYANPSLASLSIAIKRLAATVKAEMTKEANTEEDEVVVRIAQEAAQHKARMSFPLNALDYVNPNHGMGLMFYFSLQDGVAFQDVFDNLQQGLNRTFDMIPALGGKMMKRSEQEIGYIKNDLCVTIPPMSMAATAHNRLVYKDLSDVLPAFDDLRDAAFATSLFSDSLVLRDDPFPVFPADIFVGQVNFVKGGCIISADLNHCCLDGVGAVIAIKAWAENCRYLQGDASATCQWYDPESFNHSLPEIIHKQEGWPSSMDEVDPAAWDVLPFFPPSQQGQATTQPEIHPRYGFPLHNVWPLPRAERCMTTTMFLITPERLEKMKESVASDKSVPGVYLSMSDIIQAFFWRAATRARYRVAKEIRKQTFNSEAKSILELPTDGRPYFSSLLPSTYMGSVLVMNRFSMDLEALCSPDTSIGRIAWLLRQSNARITPPLIHDAFTILQNLPDHGRFSTANMGLEHMNSMISNMLLFQTSEICFGDKFFANSGSPESMRPQVERGNGRFRFLIILPMRKDGGVELMLGTHPEELAMLARDEEFIKYAELMGTEA
ncbi:putative NRPS-like protein biosynthetic cluster [Trichoderma atroviride]|uniref:putative NRPS-like protein biosynthetic cluster n=1 Tax=Hypocrea atroviridis TaxID=63577 RepID=UPI0033290C45|nr:putative NRPS-like protein biosynthetic cluster [Trichoderma atroviride]